MTSGILFPVPEDFIDWVIRRWEVESPDLDTSSIAVIGRILRLASLLERRFDDVSREVGVPFWALTMLTALRRAGHPYKLSPSQLTAAEMVSAAAITKRIARLEEMGYVKREPDPADRRGVLVALRPSGNRLVATLARRILDDEKAVLAPLTAVERRGLAHALKLLLLEVEGPRRGLSRA